MSTKHSWWAFCKSPLINCKPVQVVSQEPGADYEPNLFSGAGLLQEIESVTMDIKAKVWRISSNESMKLQRSWDV